MSGLLFLCLSTLSFSASLRQVLATHRSPQVTPGAPRSPQYSDVIVGGGVSSMAAFTLGSAMEEFGTEIEEPDAMRK
jgi:hypothetical protein